MDGGVAEPVRVEADDIGSVSPHGQRLVDGVLGEPFAPVPYPERRRGGQPVGLLGPEVAVDGRGDLGGEGYDAARSPLPRRMVALAGSVRRLRCFDV